MDISVLCAVGSFWVSENVLKPKATILVFLGCILAYDLTTKTQDVASLRAYRGPAFVSFIFFMAALSLRTWRRNGIACDELLFLPGTPHGELYHQPGITTTATATTTMMTTSTAIVASSSRDNSSHHLRNNSNINNNGIVSTQTMDRRPVMAVSTMATTTKAATSGGESWLPHSKQKGTQNSVEDVISTTAVRGDVEMGRIRCSALPTSEHTPPNRMTETTTTASAMEQADDKNVDNDNGFCSDDEGSSISSIQEFANSWDENDDNMLMDGGEFERAPLTATVADNARISIASISNSTTYWHQQQQRNPKNASDRSQFYRNGGAAGGMTSSSDQSVSNQSMSNPQQPPQTSDETTMSSDIVSHQQQQLQQQELLLGSGDRVQRFQENNPQIVRVGSFFFFRSPATPGTENAEYAPSGPSVVGAALDLTLPTLLNFHLFIEAFNHTADYYNGSEAPAKILPMIFMSVLIVRLFVPPGRRGRFWGTMKYTVLSPLYHSRFRDSFIGDILTSLVRPLQDIVFALAYYMTVVWGTLWTISSNSLADSGKILESSWILHNIVLPSCALLPLWWKFLQTLRETYDSGHRWPHLGNAFKYLSAAVVILYGMTHPEDRRSPWWIVTLFLVVLYQIWWDTVMDWDLFVIVPRSEETYETMWLDRISSSLPADSYVLFTLERFVIKPIRECIRFLVVRIPSWKQVRLRQQRLYKSETFYWRLFFYNAFTRVLWTLCFIPAYHLSSSGRAEGTTFESDTKSYIGVILPLAEMVRRTCWGFLYLENHTIHMTRSDSGGHRGCMSGDGDGGAATVGYSHANSNNPHEETDDGPGLAALADDSQQLLGERCDEVESDSGDSSKNISRQYKLPLWLSGTQHHIQFNNHDDPSSTAMTLYAQLRRPDRWYQLLPSESKHKLFLLELSIWVVAFVGLGTWATT